jgi:hypothetical protein
MFITPDNTSTSAQKTSVAVQPNSFLEKTCDTERFPVIIQYLGKIISEKIQHEKTVLLV